MRRNPTRRPGEPHELMALEDNTRIFNILKKHGGVVNDSNVQGG